MKLPYYFHYFILFFYDFIGSIFTWFFLYTSGAKVGKNLRVNGLPSLIVHPSSKIEIGSNVRINSAHYRNIVGGFHRTGIHVGKNAKLSIGNNVGLSNSTIACMDTIIIEDDVMVGGDCSIYDTDFHSISPFERLKNESHRISTRPVIIKRSAFIGAHSIILKGVTVGQNSIIGAGSVVSKDIPDNEIWAGNPVKKIGEIIN